MRGAKSFAVIASEAKQLRSHVADPDGFGGFAFSQ
jgi:hypothetical protein